MKVKKALATARALLQQNYIATPRLDAEVLLAHLLNCSRAALYAHSEQLLDRNQYTKYQQLVQKRAAGQPVAYLVGSKEFMGLDFTVNPSVLIPRPDTELMVEVALKLLSPNPSPHLLMADVGTGSGAVAVTMAHFVSRLQILAVDISAAALAVARQNAVRHKVAKRVQFFTGHLLEPLAKWAGQLDIITANLPYVPSGDLPNLSREVHCEPKLALDGGPDGLNLYRQLLPQAQPLLKTGGYLLVEIGPGQGQQTLELFHYHHWSAQLYYDLGGRERLVVGTNLRHLKE